MRIRLAAALLVAFAAPVTGQDRAAIDRIFAEFDRPGSPGCAVGVVRDGRLVLETGYGEANLDYGIPMGPTMVTYSGSVSKQFTAAAIALLVQDGVLALDDDIRRWFPELPVYGRTITIDHLVHHTSGLRDIYVLMDLAGIPLENVFSDEDAIALIAAQKELNFLPGDDFLYSNSGYFLLGQLVERATGKSLREFTTERIFRPLGMDHTHFHDRPGEIIRDRTMSYQRDGEGGFRISYLGNFDKVGAGGLYTTIEDLAKWDAQFYTPTIAGPAWLDRMHRRGVLTSGDTLDYAFGLRIGERRGLRTVQHSGSMMGFKAHLLRFPDQHYTALALCNLGAIDPGALLNAVADVDLGGLMAPEPPAAASPARPRGPVPPTVAAEVPLSGRYASEELGVEYRVVRRAGALVLVRPGAPDATLMRAADGSIRAADLILHPEADGSAFTVEAGRVRDIRFVRMQ